MGYILNTYDWEDMANESSCYELVGLTGYDELGLNYKDFCRAATIPLNRKIQILGKRYRKGFFSSFSCLLT